MLINNVTAGYSDPASVAKRGEPLETTASRILKAAETPAAPTSGSRTALSDILSKYDVKNISPTEFSEMVQKLRKAGAISENDFQELSTIRVDMESAGIAPDERTDLTAFYAQKVKQTQNKLDNPDDAFARQQLGPLMRRYDWVQKFAVVQSNPQAAGIDAMA